MNFQSYGKTGDSNGISMDGVGRSGPRYRCSFEARVCTGVSRDGL